MFHRLIGHRKPRLRLAQSLGAFTRPDQGDISPLYVFLEIVNQDRERVEVSRVYVAPKNDNPVQNEPLEGDRSLPCVLEPGESSRFRTRARSLAQTLEQAGHGGRPRLRLIVEDSLGNTHEKRFTFRVDEYARLQDD